MPSPSQNKKSYPLNALRSTPSVITVFGSGSIGPKSKEWKLAYETGFLLAKAGFTLANGGYGGTMEASAKGAKDAGGKTIGVTTDEFQGSLANPFIDQEIKTKLWRERLFKLIDLADGFLILNGATGTMVELLVIWEMLNKGLLSKPAVILGKRMRLLADFLREFPDLQFSKQMTVRITPEFAVHFLSRRLLISDETLRF